MAAFQGRDFRRSEDVWEKGLHCQSSTVRNKSRKPRSSGDRSRREPRAAISLIVARTVTPGELVPSGWPARTARMASPFYSRLLLCSASALAGLLKSAFEDLKLFRTSISKHFADFRGMLAENRDNQISTARCKSDDSDPPINRAFRPTDQSFFKQAIDRHIDGTEGRWTFGSIVFTGGGPL